MKQIPKKNYFILIGLIFVTVFITLSLVNIYKNKDKLTSSIYNYSNKITNEEFDEYMVESSDLIIYIADKYDLTNDSFEKSFMNKIDEINLKEKLIYIDKSQLSKEFLNKLKNNYGINIDIKKLPIIAVIVDRNFIKSVYVNENQDAERIIQYEVFE